MAKSNRENHRGIIEVRVNAPDDLFNAFDPSPLIGRDLDDEVEAYIVESALELPQRAYKLIIHIAEPDPDNVGHEAIASAICAYFAYRRENQARRLRLLLRDGRQSLIVGLGFLALCWWLGFLAKGLVIEPIRDFLREGLLIIGWVAIWRPAEIFLYDWRPMRRQLETRDALASMEINFIFGGAAKAA